MVEVADAWSSYYKVYTHDIISKRSPYYIVVFI